MSSITHLMSAEQLIKLPRGQHRYELVKGELLTMSPSGEQHGAVVANLTYFLAEYVRTNDLGRLYGAETGFKLESDPDTVLAPDISFISRERAGSPSNGYRQGPPDLAVEVISPDERKSKMEGKVLQWLELGAKEVWLVDPGKRTVEVQSVDGTRKLFHDDEKLVDCGLIPGLGIPISEIFK